MLRRSKLLGLEPDLITVRFGWNDHFPPSDVSDPAQGGYSLEAEILYSVMVR